ncbi:hypothetical protein LCGC14_2479850 [marine sediment metagenome]|uniref:Uncharacterized protein n=1 Tax=marine sediment metagenome TaxID=412755 RepID=A0A0F9DJZ0_9ZZZZ
MIELTIMGSKATATFMVDKIVMIGPSKVGGTTIFTVDGAEWVVTESRGVVVTMIESVRGDG